MTLSKQLWVLQGGLPLEVPLQRGGSPLRCGFMVPLEAFGPSLLSLTVQNLFQTPLDGIGGG